MRQSARLGLQFQQLLADCRRKTGGLTLRRHEGDAHVGGENHLIAALDGLEHLHRGAFKRGRLGLDRQHIVKFGGQ